MKNKKISFGIRLKEELVDKLDEIIKHANYLNSTKSELIESIISAFFSSKFNHIEKGKEFIIIKRKRDSEDN